MSSPAQVAAGRSRLPEAKSLAGLTDGRELYYRNNELFMSVAVETRLSFQTGTPRNLFKGVYNLRANSGASYGRDPKGGRFLMIRPTDENSSAPVRIVVSWFEELRRLAPMK